MSYFPLTSPPEISIAERRKSTAHLTLDTIAANTTNSTPSDSSDSKSFAIMSGDHRQHLTTEGGTRRHGYTSYTPGNGSPTTPSSPLSLPPLQLDDEFQSPNSTVSLLTPLGSSKSSPETPPMIMTDHSLLSSLAGTSTPNLGHLSPSQLGSKSFPLLPPHHPLHKKLYSATRNSPSPPHTPKGHPIESRDTLSFPFSTSTRSTGRTITNPYNDVKRSYTTTLSYLLRIPRRLRPALLITFCFVTFLLVYLNHAMQRATSIENLFTERQAAVELGRRFVEIEGLVDINDRRKQAVLAQKDEAMMQAATALPTSEAVSIAFESKSDELAAIIAFITSTTSNALPDVDTSVPLDPAIVLDFDPTRSGAKEDLELLVNEVNAIYPLVLFGRMRDPWHREVKKMLAEYRITPAPLIIDVDQRRDASTFIPIIARLLGTTELPQLLLQGKSLGSYHEVLELRDAGSFGTTLEASGVIQVKDAKKKKKGVRERERIENERILGPAPIQAE